jgi:hypothetical protein
MKKIKGRGKNPKSHHNRKKLDLKYKEIGLTNAQVQAIAEIAQRNNKSFSEIVRRMVAIALLLFKDSKGS